jgi:hypothetical protein
MALLAAQPRVFSSEGELRLAVVEYIRNPYWPPVIRVVARLAFEIERPSVWILMATDALSKIETGISDNHGVGIQGTVALSAFDILVLSRKGKPGC